MDLLQTTLCLPTCPEQLQLLCAAILRERSPCDSLSLSCDHIQNTRQLSLVASVLLAQVTHLSPFRFGRLPLVALGPEKQQAGVRPPRGQAQLGHLHSPVSVAALGLPTLRCVGNKQNHLTPSSPVFPSSPVPLGRQPALCAGRFRPQGLGCSGDIPGYP